MNKEAVVNDVAGATSLFTGTSSVGFIKFIPDALPTF